MGAVKFFIARFWPVLIPLLVFLIWREYTKWCVAKGKPVAYPDKLVLRWTVAGMLLVFIGCLATLMVTVSGQDQHYVPTSIEDGVLLPSRVEDK